MSHNAFKNLIINGNHMSKILIKSLKDSVQKKIQLSNCLIKPPKFAIILAGENPASESYVKKKIQIANEINIKYEMFRFQDDQQQSMKKCILNLNQNQDIHGILAQLPFPTNFCKQTILEMIDPKKDIDCLHPKNMLELLKFGENAAILPCTPHAILYICDHYQIPIAGKKVLIVGRSNLVGLPISLLMMKRHGTVTIAHRHSHDHLEELAREADIIVAAAGCPNLIKQVKKNCIIFDVGINRIKGSKSIVGDVDHNKIKQFGLYTPVPGGIGPLTVTMLMNNIIRVWNKNF